MPAQTNPLLNLEIDRLCIKRGERTVVHDLSFKVSSGEAIIITGPNGAGKSTLIRAIAGLLPIASGTVSIKPDSELSLAEQCQYLGHLNGLKAALTVYENLFFWQKFSAKPAITPHEALVRVGLPQIGDIPAGYLSAGQKRRAAIARLLVTTQPVWLVDEPTAALDRNSEAFFAEVLQEHVDKGGIAIAATHQKIDLKSARSLVIEPVTASLEEGLF